MPGVVLAAAILLAFSGGMVILSVAAGSSTGGLLGAVLPGWAYALCGLMYLGLAGGVYRGLRWARTATVVLCWVGILVAVVHYFGAGLYAMLEDLPHRSSISSC